MFSIHVLYDGYSYKENSKMFANCTCTLIKGEINIIVDCMTAWDKEKILQGLSLHDLSPLDIDYVIGTHGHSDHVGNLNLFSNALHVVGFTVSKGDEFFDHPFLSGEPYVIHEDVKVVATPGHTADDVSVFVTLQKPESKENGELYVIAGDIFEKEEDIEDESLWKEQSGDPDTQKKSRGRIASVANVIIPGHGPMFTVTPEIKEKIKSRS